LNYFLKIPYADRCRIGYKLSIPDALLPAFFVEITPGIAAHPATAFGGRIYVPAQRGRIVLPASADRLIGGSGFFPPLQMMAPDFSNNVFHRPPPLCGLFFAVP
jgi:hypothetical protein